MEHQSKKRKIHDQNQQIALDKEHIKRLIATVQSDIQLTRPRAVKDINAAENLALLHDEIKFYKALYAHVTKSTDINVDELNKINALHTAVRSSERVYVELCLSRGMDPARTDSEGQTALHLACEKDSLEIVQLLLENESQNDLLNKCDSFGESPLSIACSRSTPEVVNYLLARGATSEGLVLLSALSNTRRSPDSTFKIVTTLLEYGADVNHRANDRMTPLLRAVRLACNNKSSASFQICVLLRTKGADVNVQNLHGNSPLHIAVCSNHQSLVKMLLIGNHSIDARDQRGFVALFYACQMGYSELADLLVDCGANLHAHSWEDCITIYGNERNIPVFRAVSQRSRNCLQLEQFCLNTIRKNIQNFKDMYSLPLPPHLMNKIMLKQ